MVAWRRLNMALGFCRAHLESFVRCTQTDGSGLDRWGQPDPGIFDPGIFVVKCGALSPDSAMNTTFSRQACSMSRLLTIPRE